MAKSKAKRRECQSCTACCDGWVAMTIDNEDIYPGRPCQHSTRQGCTIYQDRPVDPCVNFECGWMAKNS